MFKVGQKIVKRQAWLELLVFVFLLVIFRFEQEIAEQAEVFQAGSAASVCSG
jgi:hypothetical protein